MRGVVVVVVVVVLVVLGWLWVCGRRERWVILGLEVVVVVWRRM